MAKQSGKPSGMVTLLVSSVLLLVTLLLTMGFSRVSMYQIKRAQNETVRVQQKWLAEGALECALSVSYQHESVFDNEEGEEVAVPECERHLGNHSQLSVTTKRLNSVRQEVKASVDGRVNMYHEYQRRTIQSLGTIDTTSDLLVDGALSLRPATKETEPTPDNLYQCISVQFVSRFIFYGGTAPLDPENPFSGFNYGQCRPDYKSKVDYRIHGDGSEWPYELPEDQSFFGLDFYHDVSLDPFRARFGVDRSDWERVRDTPREFSKVIHLTVATECDAKLAQALRAGHSRIWIEGDCDLGDAGSSGPLLRQNNKAKFIVVANGIFMMRGSLDNMYGVLYHFYASPVVAEPARAEMWRNSRSSWGYISKYLGTTMTEDDLQRLVLFNSGSYSPYGGYVFDAPGGFAIVSGSLLTRFNYDAVQPGYTIQWVKGTWRDYD